MTSKNEYEHIWYFILIYLVELFHVNHTEYKDNHTKLFLIPAQAIGFLGYCVMNCCNLIYAVITFQLFKILIKGLMHHALIRT